MCQIVPFDMEVMLSDRCVIVNDALVEVFRNLNKDVMMKFYW
jgi:hypothetical protein